MKPSILFLVCCVSAVGAFLEGGQLKVGTKDCDVTVFVAAQDAFANTLQLPQGTNWQVPLTLYKAIQDTYGKNSKLALANVCNAYNALLNTLNNADINPARCFDPLFLLGNEDAPDNAIHFAGVMGSLRFQCGAGFYPVVANGNWDCASRTYKAYSDDLIDALITVVGATETNIEGRCQEVKNGELSYYKYFQDMCGNPQITYFGCQSYNQFFSTIYPECSNECKLGGR